MKITGGDTPSFILQVRGLGHVPSFKNRKRAILDRNTGKQRTLTEPATKQWMDRCIQSFVSQLLCAAQTIVSGTIPGRSKLFSIVSSLPWDDSRQWIPEIHVLTVEVDKGDEGADIHIAQCDCIESMSQFIEIVNGISPPSRQSCSVIKCENCGAPATHAGEFCEGNESGGRVPVCWECAVTLRFCGVRPLPDPNDKLTRDAGAKTL